MVERIDLFHLPFYKKEAFTGSDRGVRFWIGKTESVQSEEEKTEMVWENKQVLMDDIFVKKEVFEEIEKNALFSTDFISEATDIFLDTNLKLNGVSEGIVSYSQVVKLILLYEQLE